MAPTRLRLGEPLPHQLPDRPPTDREAPKLSGTIGLHTLFPTRYYSQFPEVIPDFTGRYRRVIKPSALSYDKHLHVLTGF